MTGYVKADLIYAIADVIELVNSIPDPDEIGTLILPLGDFTVFDRIGGSMPDFWSADFDAGEDVALPDMSGFDIGSAVGGLPAGDSKAQTTKSFANGFAGGNLDPKGAAYRPAGVGVGPDGALYVTDDVKGRVWRIVYKGS